MGYERQHEVIRDVSRTFANILEKHLPARLEQKPVTCVFEAPSDALIESTAADGKVLISIILIETTLSTTQMTEQPIIREEDEEGNIVEFRLGSPTNVSPRYLITPFSKDPLEGQVVQGLIMQLFFDHPTFLPEDIQGESIHGEDRPPIHFDEKVRYHDQMAIWSALGRPYKPSLVYAADVRLDSAKKIGIRRVMERILDYKKIQG